MRIAVYTLTRDRLEYTQHSFAALREKAGVPFDHFVIDNGSEDETAPWLQRHLGDFKRVRFNFRNAGISAGSNQALAEITAFGPYDLIVKVDNDCEVVSENILGQMVEIYQDMERRKFEAPWVLSPRVEGIARQPQRIRDESFAGRRIGVVGMIGGLFRVVPWRVYEQYRYPMDLPLAWGQDDHFCAWCVRNGVRLGYVEGLVVNHYETTDGQAKRFPAYFERKWKEEKASAEAHPPGQSE